MCALSIIMDFFLFLKAHLIEYTFPPGFRAKQLNERWSYGVLDFEFEQILTTHNCEVIQTTTDKILSRCVVNSPLCDIVCLFYALVSGCPSL